MELSEKYHISGSYYEACNCDAICPCRRIDGVPGGRSTYGQCDFLLNWFIEAGHCGNVEISGISVCLAGRYHDDEAGSPWSVVIYIDETATPAQFDALAQIYQGKLGGNMGFTANISNVLATRRAAIKFSHRNGAEYVKIDDLASASVDHIFEFDGTVSCGIPGHESPGTESVSTLNVDDPDLSFSYEERCGFATTFSYKN